MSGSDDIATSISAVPDDFRKARFATGITVITSEDESEIRGMTCNSFTSINLDPATVLVSLKAGKTDAAISTAGKFGVSILRDEHQSYSAYFSGRAKTEGPPEFEVRGTTPTLRECLAWFECEVVQKVDIHDHTLFLGLVKRCGTIEGAPLMFFESRYHRYTPPPPPTGCPSGRVWRLLPEWELLYGTQFPSPKAEGALLAARRVNAKLT